MVNWNLAGIHAADAALRLHAERVVSMHTAATENPRVQALLAQAQALGISVQWHKESALERMVEGQRHQHLVTCMRPLPESGAESALGALLETTPQAFILALDGVTDSHNLGACCRVALAAGVDAIVAPADHSAPLTATTVRVSAGTALQQPYWRLPNLARALSRCRDAGVWVYGADGDATQSLYDTDLSGPIVLTMGSEGRGMRARTKKLCDQLLRIPMQAQVESLNVSVAAAVMCFEVRRQRSQ